MPRPLGRGNYAAIQMGFSPHSKTRFLPSCLPQAWRRNDKDK
ncbi:MAG: hypothetical protein ABI543_00745 [Ignavibacteria bacterium]